MSTQRGERSGTRLVGRGLIPHINLCDQFAQGHPLKADGEDHDNIGDDHNDSAIWHRRDRQGQSHRDSPSNAPTILLKGLSRLLDGATSDVVPQQSGQRFMVINRQPIASPSDGYIEQVFADLGYGISLLGWVP